MIRSFHAPRFFRSTCERSAPAFLALTLALSGCGGKPPAMTNALTPAPLLTDRALANCTYERLATIEEERSGVIVNPQAEMRRALGMKARLSGADAIIEMKLATVGPSVSGGGSSGRRANALRASAVAIKFASPTCPRSDIQR